MKDYYLILNVTPFATQDEIRSAYKIMSIKYHPDKNKSDKYFEERFKDIHEAYSVLQDIEKRKEYDYKYFGIKTDIDAFEKHNTDIKQQYEDIRIKKKQLDTLKREITLKENRLKKLKYKKSYKLLFFILLALCVFLIIFIFLKEKQNVFQNNELTQKIEKLNAEKESQISEISSLKDSLLQISMILEILKEEQITEKKRYNLPPLKVKPTTNKNENQNNQSDYVIVKNESEIDLLNFQWWSSILDEDILTLSSFSVYNKTNKKLQKFDIEWEVINNNNIPINSGYKSYDPEKMTKYILAFPVPPNNSKKIEANLYDAEIYKNQNQKLVITIVDTYFE